MDVSIHATQAGGDLARLAAHAHEGVSIHATQAGGDRWIIALLGDCYCEPYPLNTRLGRKLQKAKAISFEK
jgi:hypothetical protein